MLMINMIDLEGTEKQIAWAQDIRKQFLNNIEIINPKSSKFDLPTANWVRKQLINERGYKEYSMSPEEIEKKDINVLKSKILKMYNDVLERIIFEKDAKWFIDNRYYKGWSTIPFYLP